MRSLLNLAGGREKKNSWRISEQSGGDVTLVDVDSEEGKALWSDMTARGEAAIALCGNKEFPATFLLHKPLRSRAFLRMLDTLALAKSADDSESAETLPVSEPDSIWKPIEVDDREGQFTLAEHLRRQTWRTPIVITHTGWPLLLIDPGSGAWFFDGSIADLSPRSFAEPMPASAGVAISSDDLVERIQGHRQRPLSELKWFAGLAQARGRLHPNLLGDVEFMLTQVPAESTRNEHLQQLAQILIRGPIRLDALADQSAQPPENVTAFLNACYTSGKLLVNRVAKVSSF